ncbi:MAG: SDR family oxidoreductase [Chloroflexi bacterium]|nr:SDR family oxidoreductase [Chloroflexota bacterium]
MKTAIITGGGSGIGFAIARSLAKEKFRVGLIGRRGVAVEAASQAINRSGGDSWWGAVDVRDEAAVSAFVESAVAQYGKIDLLVNNAGVFKMRPIEETTVEFWDETLDINLKGAFIFSKAVWPHISGGQIINISSVAGIQAFPGNAAYCASKFGLNGLSEVLALEGKARNIRVHLVCPGNTQTQSWDDQAPAEVQARMMPPEAVAEVVRWLAVSPPEVTFDKVAVNPARDPWR